LNDRLQLAAALEAGLPDLLPAHDVLGETSQEGCDYLYIQGRRDRLHAFLCIDDELVARVESFNEVKANWLWLVIERGKDGWSEMARRYRLGVIGVEADGRLVCLVEALPRPGIFAKQHRELVKQWRGIAGW
jgi:hypothetical protein